MTEHYRFFSKFESSTTVIKVISYRDFTELLTKYTRLFALDDFFMFYVFITFSPFLWQIRTFVWTRILIVNSWNEHF